jgi:hypothetical protein
LFESINKQLMKEYQSGETPEDKINKILEQNRSIAEALVAFGSKMDNVGVQQSSQQMNPDALPEPPQQFRQSQMPSMQQQQRQEGIPVFRQVPPEMDRSMPPPPPPPGQQEVYQMPVFPQGNAPEYPSPSNFQPKDSSPGFGGQINLEHHKRRGLFSRR